MTAHSKKTTQKRLHNCVLSQPKWAQKHEALENCACGTGKIDDFTVNAAVRVANATENAKLRRKTTLLGKYPIISIRPMSKKRWGGASRPLCRSTGNTHTRRQSRLKSVQAVLLKAKIASVQMPI